MAVLGDVGDARVGRSPHALAGDLASVDRHPARVRRAHPGDRVDELLLPVPVDPRDRDDLAGPHGQRHPGDLLELTVVADVQFVDLQQWPSGSAGGLRRP